MSHPGPMTLLAPAKINLYLHLCGRRENGYHDLDSLATFTTIGDQISIEPSHQLSLAIRGPFARSFSAAEMESGPTSKNLIIRAVREASILARKPHDFRIILTKNLPLDSGLGGGSSDAATVLWALLKYWDIPVEAPWVGPLMLRLGADVPVCLRCQTVRFRGVGDIFDATPPIPEMPIVLVNPLKRCPTREVFTRVKPPFVDPIDLPAHFDGIEDLIAFLYKTSNMMTDAAREIVPEIDSMIDLMMHQPGCLLSRMSGSGATIFGLFESEESALAATENITLAYPRWWVRTGMIHNLVRY
jgi:4-diphosphocytidyl-2-C-methyl-D-erythritol kinase